MNNKEFITTLANRLDTSTKDVSGIIEFFIADMVEELQAGNVISIQGFGTFEVKKKAERISVNPTTKLRLLVPPKLTLVFKPGSALKDKFK